jgi:hypothetical protein
MGKEKENRLVFIEKKSGRMDFKILLGRVWSIFWQRLNIEVGELKKEFKYFKL